MNVLLALSAHGYGHLSQVAPIINALRKDYPQIQLVVQGMFERELLASRIEGDFELLAIAADVGCAMFGPTEIDWETTLQWYREFHQDWDSRLQQAIALLGQHQVDLVVADVPYLPLAAAAAADIPAVAFSSLNWMDTLLENPVVADDLENELAIMHQCYREADCFILPEPSVPSLWLDNRRPVAPVSATVTDRRKALHQSLGIMPEQKVVLVSLGGIPMQNQLSLWPQIPGVVWLLDGVIPPEREDLRSTAGLDWPFPDYIGSVDAIVTKPGYGTFSEVSRCGLPVLNIERVDWVESSYLQAWLAEKVALVTVPLEQVRRGDISTEIRFLLDQPRRTPYLPCGIGESVSILASLLSLD